MSGRVILVFARAPVPGRTKTRLIPALGEVGAAKLHQQLLESTLAKACAVQDSVVELWCHPDSRHPVFKQLANKYPCCLQQQKGNDLGECLANAMRQALANHSQAIVVGTDIPELGTQDLTQGFAMLEEGKDAVIGPAADGGYYLLGLRYFEAALFSHIDWGSEHVLAQTVECMEQYAMHYGQLTIKHDLDRPEDLKHYPQLLEP